MLTIPLVRPPDPEICHAVRCRDRRSARTLACSSRAVALASSARASAAARSTSAARRTANRLLSRSRRSRATRSGSGVVSGRNRLPTSFKAACGADGAHVIYDAIGGDYSEAALRAIAWAGRHLVICGLQTHFLDNMYGWVRVLADDGED